MWSILSRQLDRLRDRRDIARFHWRNVQIGLVISTGRTGTNFVQSLFSQILTGVDARHEPRPDLFDIGTRRMRGELTDDDATRELRLLRLAIRKELVQSSVERYVESNNNMAYLLPQIFEVWPQARIVHIVRDGRDFVRSSYSKKVVSRSANELDALFMTDDDKRRRLQACDLSADAYRERWAVMSRFERLAWYWMTKDRLICDGLKDHQASLRVRFEDLFSAELGVDCVLCILKHLQLTDVLHANPDEIAKLMVQRVNESSEYLLPRPSEWTDEKQRQFNEIAGVHMRHLGYSV